ncbi:MAG TPA: glycosyltransferase family 39 protein, partial [Candidatus Kapabacteria bacterium]|nr:glycosyltransferase family 39 protein [Candidatus Kapabacteria bacterium]
MPLQDKRTVVVTSLLFITALIVRVIGLDLHFLLIDEAFVGVAARDIAFNNTPMWDAVSNAPYVWGLAQMIGAFGDSPFVLRLPSAIFGASVSLLIFLFIRKWAGERAATLSAAIYALHPFALAFTRVAFVDALQLPAIWMAIFAIDRYLVVRERKWLITALLAAALAFIFKYNAIAVIGCWMLIGLVLRRYSIKTSLWLGAAVLAVSFGTLLLWPFDAPLWFFSFLAKGGSYNGQYIWDFYHYAYRHVTFGSATLPIALIAYILIRSRLTRDEARRYDHLIIFSIAYFGLLLFLGRPFQRYLLVLTIPVAIVYSMLIVQGYNAFREWMLSRNARVLVRTAAGLAVLCGVLI